MPLKSDRSKRSKGGFSYASSLTASSEDSPVRADYRVRRAAQLAAKTYLEDVSMKVEKVKKGRKGGFEPALLKTVHKEINGR